MLSNFHTHTTKSDGKNTPEEIVKVAIEKGLKSIGFSDHGYTEFDLSYCMKDTDGYIDEITRLKTLYKGQIGVYLGVEEDAFHQVDRKRFDYIIGSAHYVKIDGEYFSVDGFQGNVEKCLGLCGGDPVKLADVYYKAFCDYIVCRKPDIIGHFDLITKFDKQLNLFLKDKKYLALSEKYFTFALTSGSLVEVNTGAIARGYRTSPYPSENLLRITLKNGNGVILSSDTHNTDNLTFGFEQAIQLLKEVGFKQIYTISNGKFVTENI